MLRKLLKLQRLKGDARAASRGPKALGKRLTERAAHRLVRRLFR